MEDIKTSVGQVVSKITICIDGVTISVVPLSIAAKRMGYTNRHTRFLCNSLQLIAIKICGLWFIHELEIETYPQKVMKTDSA